MLAAFPGQWCIPGGWDTLGSGASISRAAQPMTHSREDGTGGHWLLPNFWAPRSSPAHLIVTADKPQQLTCFFPIHFATISSCGHSSQFLHSGRPALDCGENPLVWQAQANPKHPCSWIAAWQGGLRQDLRQEDLNHIWLCCATLSCCTFSQPGLQPLPSSERPNFCLDNPELPPQFSLQPLLLACISSLFSHSHVLHE